MKSKYYGFLLFLFIISETTSVAQVTQQYYVVIGGFALQENAVRFANKANQMNFNALYAWNPSRQVYYVYVFSTTDRKEAFTFANRVKSETLYKDCWVFTGSLGSGPSGADDSVDQDPVTQQPIEEIDPKDTGTKISADDAQNDTETVLADSTTTEEPVESKPEGKRVMFKLTSATTNNSIEGMVRLQESDRASQYIGYEGNEEIFVTPPNNRNEKWIVVCQVVGYRRLKETLDYNNPQSYKGAMAGPEGEVVIPLALERVKKGDYVELDSVIFHNNSASFLAQSKRQLHELVNMMNENPKYRIRIHGHVNGKQVREMITRNSGQDLFTLISSNKRQTVSAKSFSKHRAEAVEEYLLNNQIESSRIKVVGDGATHNVYKGTLAVHNDRIEVEITRD